MKQEFAENTHVLQKALHMGGPKSKPQPVVRISK